MHHLNPYTQAGWSRGNGNGNNGNGNNNGSSSRSSVYGALPYSSIVPSSAQPSPPPNLLNFQFQLSASRSHHQELSILNSTLLGPDNRPIMRITTDAPQMVGYTTFENDRGSNLALIEWQRHPLVEVRNSLSKRGVGSWLELSQDKTFRDMDVFGRNFAWVPQEGSICLYRADATRAQVAKIYRSNNAVILQIDSRLVDEGLIEVCAVAAVLLQCGRFID